MDLFLDDEGFVRAPVDLVYRRLVDLAGYGAWWPGLRVKRAAPAGATWDAEAEGRDHPQMGYPREPGASVLDVQVRCGWRGRALRLTLRPYRFRAGKGLLLDLAGDVVGTAEWWLEEGFGGTVVHHLTRADVARRRAAAVALRYRVAVRHGLWGLKDACQSQVRAAVGLAP